MGSIIQRYREYLELHHMSDSMVISNNVIDLFGTDIAFTIPLYQRSYAWEYDQIKQLIDDISDVKEGKKYYLGSLVVFERKDKNIFEVVDGQQRLTTLYLLMKCLGIDTRLTLEFDCRDRSKKTLENLYQNLGSNNSLAVCSWAN